MMTRPAVSQSVSQSVQQTTCQSSDSTNRFDDDDHYGGRLWGDGSSGGD